MVDMIIHNGIQYRPEDAERLGITPDPEPKARAGSQNRARTAGDGDKARRPSRARTKKGSNDAGDTTRD